MATSVITVPETSQALTAVGSAIGVLTVASTADLYAGATCWLATAAGADSVKVRIVDIIGPTNLRVRILPEDPREQGNTQRYGGGSDLSAYPAGSVLAQPVQNVRAELAFSKIPRGNF